MPALHPCACREKGEAEMSNDAPSIRDRIADLEDKLAASEAAAEQLRVQLATSYVPQNVAIECRERLEATLYGPSGAPLGTANTLWAFVMEACRRVAASEAARVRLREALVLVADEPCLSARAPYTCPVLKTREEYGVDSWYTSCIARDALAADAGNEQWARELADLERDLAELEATDPDVAAAAAELERVKAGILKGARR